MWDRLMAALDELTKHYEELSALEKKKRTALATVNLKALELIVKAEQQQAEAVSRAEEKRREVMMRISVSSADMRPDMTLMEALAFCPDKSIRTKLQSLGKRLGELSKLVEEQQQNNSVLVNGALQAVRYRLNQLGATEVEPTYGRGGSEVVSRGRGLEIKA